MTRISIMTVALALAACDAQPATETPKSAHDAGHGTARVYDATFDQAWAAAHAAIRWDKVGTPVDHRTRGGEAYVLTRDDSTSKESYAGTQMGVWVEPLSPSKVKVSVVVMGPDILAVGGPNEEQVQKDIAKAIGLEQSGAPIPDDRP